MEIIKQLLRPKSITSYALFFLVFLLILSIFIPFISPYAEDLQGAVHFEIANQQPSISHWFGTDAAGRDMFTLTIGAAITSLKIALMVVFISVLVGTPFGLIAGTFGGWIDEIIMRVADGFLAFPPLILPIMITAVLGPSLENVILGIAISWFPWYVRIARAQAVVVKNYDFVLVSKTLGASRLHIIIKHILPNSISPIVIQGSIDAGYAILISAGLSFIGLGAQPPEVEWGLLITQSRVQFLNYWWTITFPGLFIIFTVMCFNIIGDGLRDILNPKIVKD